MPSFRFTTSAIAVLCLALAASPGFADVITTADGNGADTHITNDGNSADTTTHGTSTSMEIRQFDGTRTRLLYLRFDLSSVVGDISGATFSLDFTGSNRTRTLNVYGLNDGDPGENWDESTINYQNAPGMLAPAQGDNAGYYAVDGTRLTLLGTFAVTNAAGVYTSDPTTLPLDTFLNNNTDHLATLVVIYDGSDSNADYHVSSKEDTTVGNTPPTLTFQTGATVPEPASLSLLALGAIGLLGRRRR